MRETVDLPSSSEASLIGTVLSIQANYYCVKIETENGEDTEDRFLHLCTRRDRLKKIGQQVMVGDRVYVEEPDWESGRAAIYGVMERRSQLDRPPVANADQILLVFALAKPALDISQLSRFLVKAESTGIEVCLCLSKSDLMPTPHREAWRDRLRAWGYEPVLLSSYTGLGIEELSERLAQRVTVVSGPSGVGKSSLINMLVPAAKLRTSAVSGKLERGRHTTRHVELFELEKGGLLADTPGFNQPDMDALPHALMDYFPEIRSRLTKRPCHFSDCLHLQEPGCRVRGDWERYELYTKFLEEAIALEANLAHQTNPDAALKQKSNSTGGVTYEPRLKSKYRAESRRSQQQGVQVMKGNMADWLDENDEN
jgi:ribosome biogenesis GTPase / thiamine phosphate phosphatase